MFSQQGQKNPNKNLRCKGELEKSLPALGAPGRLFLTAISRQDIDGAGLASSIRTLERRSVQVGLEQGFVLWTTERQVEHRQRGTQLSGLGHSNWLNYLLFLFPFGGNFMQVTLCEV